MGWVRGWGHGQFQVWGVVTIAEDSQDIAEELHYSGFLIKGFIFKKIGFSIFSWPFLLQFYAKTKPKLLEKSKKRSWKTRKSDFFKNEAFNQKSGTVKLFGYVLTIFRDCYDPPDLKLAMPPASNSTHEKHGF